MQAGHRPPAPTLPLPLPSGSPLPSVVSPPRFPFFLPQLQPPDWLPASGDCPKAHGSCSTPMEPFPYWPVVRALALRMRNLSALPVPTDCCAINMVAPYTVGAPRNLTPLSLGTHCNRIR
ncbi:hypothetical protein FKM82_031001 [Ascaphus truei]